MKGYLENSFNFLLSDELNLYYCGKRVKTLDHSYGPEVRQHYLLMYCVDGTAVCKKDDDEISFGAHDLYVMFPNEKIHYEVNKNSLWTISWVGVYGKFAYEIFDKIGVTPENPVFKISDFEKVSDLYEKIYNYSFSDNLNDKVHVISLLYRLFTEFIPDNKLKQKIDYVSEATNIIDYNYDKNISVEDIAKKLYINPCYLSRIFKEEKKISVKQYITEKRITRAKQMLETGAFSVGIVSASVGISDPLYFSRLFKKYTGVSPKDYSNQHRWNLQTGRPKHTTKGA